MLEAIETISAVNTPVDTSMIILHGLGADGNDLTSIAAELSLPSQKAIRFIFPHAPIRPISLNGGARMRGWYDIKLPSLSIEEDIDGIQTSEKQIIRLIERERQRGISAQRIILAGFSQGAAMTLQTGLRYPERLGGLICLSGYLPLHSMLESERSKMNHDVPIFMGHGGLDPVVPSALGIFSREKLRALGYQIEWHDYAMGHQICPQEIADIDTWLGKIP